MVTDIRDRGVVVYTGRLAYEKYFFSSWEWRDLQFGVNHLRQRKNMIFAKKIDIWNSMWVIYVQNNVLKDVHAKIFLGFFVKLGQQNINFILMQNLKAVKRVSSLGTSYLRVNKWPGPFRRFLGYRPMHHLTKYNLFTSRHVFKIKVLKKYFLSERSQQVKYFLPWEE